jgi:hypothetical protein
MLHLIIKNLYEQKIYWKPHDINFLCWAFYYVNGGSKVDVNVSQLMHCLIYYDNLTAFVIINQRTRLMKSLVSCFKSNGIIALKKHVLDVLDV